MKHAIALDIGGTRIKYMLVNQQGDILRESSEATQPKTHGLPLAGRLQQIIRKMLSYASSDNREVSGIGIGVPSVVEDGKILFANNLPELDNSSLNKALAAFNLPVFIENDANLMGLGEVVFGAAQELTDIVFLTVGTGIGGALFLNGRLYGGYRNRGAELGHLIIQGQNGHPCTCGTSGCLEAHASVSALVSHYRRLRTQNKQDFPCHIDGKLIVERYEAHEEEARIAMEAHFQNLALGIASLIHIFAPQKVIIGGGISESGAFYIQHIRERVGELVMKETASFTTIECARLGNKAGCLGAAALVFNHTN